MKKLLLILCCFPLLMAATCEDDDDELPTSNCTGEAVAGLNVTVRDAITGEYQSDGVTVSAVDGTYSETLELVPGSAPATFAGAWERVGTYVVTIEKAGYATYTSNPITVTQNPCHVNGQNLNAQVDPL